MRNGPYELVIAPADYPGMKYRGRYCYEHHLVWWQNTGEVPGPDELIHHENEQKRDNSFGNLRKKTRAAHTAEHTRERAPAPVDVVCGNCGATFKLMPHFFRQRTKQSKRGALFCSISCSTTDQFSIPG